MEMPTTPTTTPEHPVASSSGLAASPDRHHGPSVAQLAAGGGRGNADHAEPIAG